MLSVRNIVKKSDYKPEKKCAAPEFLQNDVGGGCSGHSIDVLAKERKLVYLKEMQGGIAKREIRQRTMQVWQEWNTGAKGRWTLIKNLSI